MRHIVLLMLFIGCRGGAPLLPPAPVDAPVANRPAPALKTCGIESGQLAGDRVGALRLGMTPREVREHCTVVRDTIEDVEGERERFLIINAGGEILRAHVWPDDRVATIYTTSPHFQTADSIRVGVPLRRLLAFTDLFGGYGESAFVVFSNAPTVCGLSFEIEFAQRGFELRDVSRAGLMAYADSARVKAIFARGCK